MSAVKSLLENRMTLAEMKSLSGLISKDELEVLKVLKFCLSDQPKLAFRSAWLLEDVAYFHPDSFKIVVPEFLKAYPKIKNLSVKRHFTKILMLLTKSSEKSTHYDFDECLETTFDWLLDKETPLAVQCNAMDVIYNLSYKDDWVLEELKNILEQKLITQSPALISRSKRILKRYKSH